MVKMETIQCEFCPRKNLRLTYWGKTPFMPTLTAIQSNLLYVVPTRMIGTPSAINENNSSGILDYPPNLLKTLFPAIHL